MDIYYLIGSLMFSAFFSGMEIAFVASNKLHIEVQGQKGNITGKILTGFQNKPSQYIGTTLIGNTLALVIYGVFITRLLQPLILTNLPEFMRNEGSALVLQTIVATMIVLVTAEFTPKSIFLVNPNRMLSIFALPMAFIYYLLFIPVYLVVGLSKFTIVKLLGIEYSDDKPVFGLTDLNDFIKRTMYHEKSNDSKSIRVDAEIFQKALEFKTIKVRECMIPRTEITAFDLEDTNLEELNKLFVESGHSKILVFKESIDEVIGYVHSSELFKKPRDIESIITPILMVPETLLANELMIQFMTEYKSLALVIDEFGGTSGLVSIEDIMEEIFGEIQDEHDDEDLVEQQLDKYNFILSARHEIDYLNDKYHWNLPTGEYETIGGFILSITGDLPKKDDIIKLSNYSIIILSMEDIRIDTLKFSILKDNY